MKKHSLPFLLLGLLVSCTIRVSDSVDNSVGDSIDNSIDEYGQDDLLIKDTLNIEKFAADFYRSHQNMANNSITREEASKEFRKQFKASVNTKDLLKGIPMNLRSLKANQNGKYTAHFWSISIDRSLIFPFEHINVDYSVSIPRDVALQLVEKNNYLLDVKYVAHVENIPTFQFMVGYDDWVLTDNFGINPIEGHYSVKQTFDIDLGMMIVDFEAIHPYSKK